MDAALSFEARDGQTCMLCPDDHWWLSPACRTSPERCIPIMTGGSAWAVEELVEKSLAYNMPLVLGIAVSWSDYLSNFKDNRVLSWTWTPSKHLGVGTTLDMIFPRHNASSWRQKVRSSTKPPFKCEKVAWSGLEVAAPDAFVLGQKMEFTETDVQNMFRYQDGLGDTEAAA